MLLKVAPVCSLAHLLDRNAEIAAREGQNVSIQLNIFGEQTVHTVPLDVRSTSCAPSLARDAVCAIEQTHDSYDAHIDDARPLSMRPNPATSVAARYRVGVGFASLIDNVL